MDQFAKVHIHRAGESIRSAAVMANDEKNRWYGLVYRICQDLARDDGDMSFSLELARELSEGSGE